MCPRSRRNIDGGTMREAYENGLVFRGRIIDWRHYLDDQLSMHNRRQSFAGSPL